MKKIQVQGMHHLTIVGSTKQSAVDFWQGVLGMPFVMEQPNLGNPDENHLYFDPGDGRLLTVFTNESRQDAGRPARAPFTLEQRLLECGYNEHAQTLFIWQGVTQYLTPEGVDRTLAFVAYHSGPGSSIIFDYMYTSLLDGTVKRGEVSKMRRDRWLSNEVLTFGIPEGTITAFLEQRGFTQVHDANFKYLHDTYFTGVNARRTVADGYAIASAVVKSK